MNKKNKNFIKVLFTLLAFVVAGIIFSCSVGRKVKDAKETVTIIKEESGTEEASEEAPDETVCVHVCGSVTNPGVYYLASGARIHEAVEMAGGMTEEADSQYVNLAREAEDGAKIYIPSREEVAAGLVPPEAADEAAAGRVNINTASMEELQTLPGIGSIKAEAIISYRESAGAFTAIEDIMNVAGIKESSYEKIKEHIKV